MLPVLRSCAAILTASFLLTAPTQAFQSPLSEEAVRDAYFRGQHNDGASMSFLADYFRVLDPPDKGPYIAEVEIYTPYVQVVEASRRRSMGYSAQQAEKDYRRRHDKLFVRVRIDFTSTYGALELYRSAKGDQEQSGSDQPLPDFYRDFRVGLSQKNKRIEPMRILLQSTDTFNTGHYAFIPEDLALAASLSPGAAYGYDFAGGGYYPTGWLVWLEYDAKDVASDDAEVEVITTDGQDVVVPFDLSRLH
jgi:hypothetical protein